MLPVLTEREEKKNRSDQNAWCRRFRKPGGKKKRSLYHKVRCVLGRRQGGSVIAAWNKKGTLRESEKEKNPDHRELGRRKGKHFVLFHLGKKGKRDNRRVVGTQKSVARRRCSQEEEEKSWTAKGGENHRTTFIT